jgi:WD40 repeat protein
MRPISTVPNELVEARNRHELIVCVGPALGSAAGLPSTAQLAIELLADAESSDRELDATVLRDWIAGGRITESLEILERRLGSRFRRVVERLLADRGRPVPPLARAIAGLRHQLRAVYTTGIDRLLERAFADEWPSFSSPRFDVAQRSKLIFKLCGTLEFPETWVLTRATLEREFGVRSVRRDLFGAVGRANHLLFVGFDPDDELTGRLLGLLELGETGVQLPGHFIVLERPTLEQRALLERRGLQVILGEAVALLETLGGKPSAATASPHVDLPRCPYPGLQAFDGSLAEVFHGRRAEVSQATARLGGPEPRRRRWLAIDGSSGVGKTSFVHAGVVPALCRGFAEGAPTRWNIARMRPGRRPLRALVEALATETITTPEALVEFVRLRANANQGLLVIVDQLEELVTLSSADENDAFAVCLAQLLEQPQFHLITTLRSDFVAALSTAAPVFARLLNEQAERYTLAPISRVGLRVAIAEPAAQLGVLFEGELVERIANDAEHHLGSARDDDDGVVRTDDAALPLVAHVLRGLWDARAGADGVITFAEYRMLGGVSGALSRSADGVLAQLDPDQRMRARTLLLRMVDLDEGRIVRRTLTRAEALALAGERGERLLELLSGGAGPRLLVVRSEENEVLVDLVHEALLREWDTLRGWIAADQAQLARDEALARRAAAWVAQGRPRRGLPRGPERRELLRGRAHGRDAAQRREYQRAIARAGWFRAGGWMGFVGVLGLIGSFVVQVIEREKGLREQTEAELQHERNEVEDKTHELETKKEELETKKEELETKKEELENTERREQVGEQLDEHRCHVALHHILTALPDDDSPELREILADAVHCRAVVGELGRTAGGPAPKGLGFDPEGGEVWVGREGAPAERWSLRDHELRASEGAPTNVDSIVFSPRGERMAFGSSGMTMLRARDAEGKGVWVQGSKPVFSNRGGDVATWQKKRWNLFDATSGEFQQSGDFEGTAEALRFSANDDTLFVAIGLKSGSRVERIALNDSGPHPDLAIPGYLRDIDVSPIDRLLASVSSDMSVRMWDLDTGAENVKTLDVQVQNPSRMFVRFSPDGQMLMALKQDGVVVLTDVDLNILSEHTGVRPDFVPSFVSDGGWLLIADAGPSVSLRGAGTGEVVARVDIQGELWVLAASPQGNAIVGGFADGRLIHWGVDMHDHWRDPNPPSRRVEGLEFSPTNPRELAAIHADGVQTWTIGAIESKPSRVAEWTRGLVDSKCTSKEASMSESLAIECADGEVLWQPSRPISAEPSKLAITAIAVSETGDRLVLGGSNGEIELWRLDSGTVTITPIPQAHAGTVTSLAFEPSGQQFVSGGNDDLVKLWKFGEIEPLFHRSMEGTNVETVAISAAPGRIAAGDDKTGKILVWDLDGNELHEFEQSCSDRVTALEFSPDGERLAAGCSNGEVLAWPLGHAARVELACQRLARTSSELPPICLEK